LVVDEGGRRAFARHMIQLIADMVDKLFFEGVTHKYEFCINAEITIQEGENIPIILKWTEQRPFAIKK
jgi:hypothetical protein